MVRGQAEDREGKDIWGCGGDRAETGLRQGRNETDIAGLGQVAVAARMRQTLEEMAEMWWGHAKRR